MNESQLRNKVSKELAGTKWYYQKISDRFTAGIPDYILCIDSRFVTIELKIDERGMTPLQMWTRERIENAGGYYIVIHYVNNTKTYEVDWRAKTLQPIQSLATLKEVMDFIRRTVDEGKSSFGR
jgi:hypothetical protein